MTAALLAGLACGLGIWLVVAGLYPAPEPLAAVLARYTAPAPTPRAAGERWDRRLGRLALEHVPVLARAVARARADLGVVGRQPEDLVGEMAVYLLFGLGLGPWFGFVTWLVGALFPVAAAGALSLAVAGGGALAWHGSWPRGAARRARGCGPR
jgi:tight adherence protein C